MNYNSTKNQEIKSKFVGIHVYANVNDLVNFVLSSEDSNKPFDWDDINNMYELPELHVKVLSFDKLFLGGQESDREEFIEELQELIYDSEDKLARDKITDEQNEENCDLVNQAIEELNDLEFEHQEIFEWWLVSDYLGTALEDMGEPIINDGSRYYWGRCCTGQAILLDYSIGKVCEGMEILEGQSIEWKV